MLNYKLLNVPSLVVDTIVSDGLCKSDAWKKDPVNDPQADASIRLLFSFFTAKGSFSWSLTLDWELELVLNIGVPLMLNKR